MMFLMRGRFDKQSEKESRGECVVVGRIPDDDMADCAAYSGISVYGFLVDN